MILCAILTFFVGILNALFALLPDWDWTASDMAAVDGSAVIGDSGTIVTDGTNPLDAFGALAAKVNGYVPVDHAIWSLQFLILLWSVILAFRAVRWIINVVRGAGA